VKREKVKTRTLSEDCLLVKSFAALTVKSKAYAFGEIFRWCGKRNEIYPLGVSRISHAKRISLCEAEFHLPARANFVEKSSLHLQ